MLLFGVMGGKDRVMSKKELHLSAETLSLSHYRSSDSVLGL